MEKYLKLLFQLKHIKWVFSGVGVVLIAFVCRFITSKLSKGPIRINNAIQKYTEIYKGNGYRLECLIPTGIHNLKSNKEIDKFFTGIMRIESHHPLRNWKNDIEKIGYKKFFEYAFLSGKELNKESINIFIQELKG